MTFTNRTIPEWRARWLIAWAAATGVSPNLQPGNLALAMANCDAGQADTLEEIAEKVLAFARASTATGPDLDSFMADFGFVRRPAQYATGTVTFGTPIANAQQSFIPVGTIIQTPGGAIEYIVITDNSQPAYNASQNAYVLAPGRTSVNVTTRGVISGATSNVQVNQLSQIQGSLFGISTVTNLTSIVNGVNAETDPQFRARFIAFINSLSKGTYRAILEAIQTVQAGLKIALRENVKAINNPPTSFIDPYYGNFVALIGGNPSDALLDAVGVAIDEVRAFTIQFQRLRTFILNPIITVNVKLAAGADPLIINPIVQQNILVFANAGAIGGPLWLDKINQIAIDSDPKVITTQPGATTIAGVGSDFIIESWQEVICSANHIVVGNY